MSQTPHEDPTVAPPGSVDQPLDPAGSTEPTAPATPTHRGQDPDPLRSSRASGFYAAIVALGVVLVLLVIFIVQNTERQDVKFLWLEGRAPLAVLLLIATAAGIFLTSIGATLRLMQVRRRVKRERKARR